MDLKGSRHPHELLGFSSQFVDLVACEHFLLLTKGRLSKEKLLSAAVYEAKLEVLTRGQVVAIIFFLVGGLALSAWVGLGSSVHVLVAVANLGVPVVAILIFSALRPTTTVRVFEDRFEVVNSFLVKNSRRIEASKIESVDFSESLLGRSRYGRVIVRGSGIQAISVSPVKDPEELAEAIRAISSRGISKTTSAPATASGGDTQSLSALIEMKTQGHLTEEEFSAAKNKLLG